MGTSSLRMAYRGKSGKGRDGQGRAVKGREVKKRAVKTSLRLTGMSG